MQRTVRRGVGCTLIAAVLAVTGDRPAPAQSVDSAAALQGAILQAKEKVLPAVVNIQPVSEVYVAGTKRKVTAVGSGVVYSPRGFVLTNYHVAGKATRLICTLANKERVPAKLVGGDPYTDLAVIKLDLDKLRGNSLTWASLGNSDEVKTGEFVLALGSPLALAHSLSVGVVSAKDRYFPNARTPTGETTGSYNTWIQTDAAINPGNSGGPLVNLRGEVIGINARKAMFGENLGFAIPINVAKEVAEEIVAKGKVRRSWLGLSFQPLQDFEAYFSAGGKTPPKGVLVRDVTPESPAERAGVRTGDILTAVNGHAVDARFYSDIPPIRRLIASAPIGKRLTITVRRGGRETPLVAVTEELGRVKVTEFECKAWGCTVKVLAPDAARRMGLPDASGVLVSGVKNDSVADKGKLAQSDVIVEVNRSAVKDLAGFQKAYKKAVAAKTATVLVKVRQGGGVLYRLLKTKPAKPTTKPKPRRKPTPKPKPTTRPAPTTRPTTRPATGG